MGTGLRPFRAPHRTGCVLTGPYRPFDGDAWLGRDLPLADGPYRILPETAFEVAEEMAFARQGRKARVFKLSGPDGSTYALKTFYRGFSLPEYAAITPALAAFGDIGGLRTCQRRLVEPAEAAAIGEPGLAYAVLMPWIEGVSWAGVVEGRYPLSGPYCLDLAAQTANILAELEAGGLAHADVSSSNVFITSSDSGAAVELIDVEDMYHDSLGSLPYVPDGSPGYAHPRNHGRGCRNRYGDRFAGGVLLTEMLVWPDPTVRQSCADVSVFEPGELCHGGPKYRLVRDVLQARSMELVRLFERVWDSPGPPGCPRLSEWAAAIAGVAASEAVAPPQQRHATAGGIGVRCPGCGRSPLLGLTAVDHEPDCPLRGASTHSLTPDKSSFPGVPTHEDIAFVPLFGA
jgi:hypothetical protein